MNCLYTVLVTLAFYCQHADSRPQGITLNYKPNRPFYATGWTNYPSQIHPPGTPWPASAEGYTSTTTAKPWWAVNTEEIVANAVSISSEAPASPSTSTTPNPPPTTTTTTLAPPPTTTTRATTTARVTTARTPAPTTTARAPPPTTTARAPPPATTLANTIDVSTIGTKVPPVQASTEGTLFTSAPEAAGGGDGPQGPPKRGSWSRPPKPVSPAPESLPSRTSSEDTPIATNNLPMPNNLTLSAFPLLNPAAGSAPAPAPAPEPFPSFSAVPSLPASAVMSSAPDAIGPSTPATVTTVNDRRNVESDLNVNSRFSSPHSLRPESQEAPESAWVWEFHEGDGKTSSREFYDASAIILDFK